MNKDRFYSILVSGGFTVLGIFGIMGMMNSIDSQMNADSVQFFDGLVGLIFITVILATTFVFQSILGIADVYKYMHVHGIRANIAAR
jgi:hypothetical protein